MRSAHVQALVLAYIGGAAAACDKPQPPPTAPMSDAPSDGGSTPTATGTPTPTPTASASAAPSTSPLTVDPPPASPPSSSADPNGIRGKTCKTNADCPGMYCQRVFTGARFTDDLGQCVTEQPIYRGRPLDVGNGPELAELARLPFTESVSALVPDDAGRAEWAARLAAAAREEHASIAAFARTICELMARGAPSWLVAATSRALADEIRHADESFAWSEKLGAPPRAPASFPSAIAPFPSLDRDSFVRDVVRGGCIGETLAVSEALAAADEAPDPALRAFFLRIADDEARHAALAFDTVRWLCTQEGALRSAVADEVARFRESASATSRAIVEPLLARLEGPAPPTAS